jgi:hypothetical protein
MVTNKIIIAVVLVTTLFMLLWAHCIDLTETINSDQQTALGKMTTHQQIATKHKIEGVIERLRLFRVDLCQHDIDGEYSKHEMDDVLVAGKDHVYSRMERLTRVPDLQIMQTMEQAGKLKMKEAFIILGKSKHGGGIMQYGILARSRPSGRVTHEIALDLKEELSETTNEPLQSQWIEEMRVPVLLAH